MLTQTVQEVNRSFPVGGKMVSENYYAGVSGYDKNFYTPKMSGIMRAEMLRRVLDRPIEDAMQVARMVGGFRAVPGLDGANIPIMEIARFYDLEVAYIRYLLTTHKMGVTRRPEDIVPITREKIDQMNPLQKEFLKNSLDRKYGVTLCSARILLAVPLLICYTDCISKSGNLTKILMAIKNSSYRSNRICEEPVVSAVESPKVSQDTKEATEETRYYDINDCIKIVMNGSDQTAAEILSKFTNISTIPGTHYTVYEEVSRIYRRSIQSLYKLVNRIVPADSDGDERVSVTLDILKEKYGLDESLICQDDSMENRVAICCKGDGDECKKISVASTRRFDLLAARLVLAVSLLMKTSKPESVQSKISEYLKEHISEHYQNEIEVTDPTQREPSAVSQNADNTFALSDDFVNTLKEFMLWMRQTMGERK